MCEKHILHFLQKHGSPELVGQKDKHGFTPLHYALRILRPQTCEILISHGANLLEGDPDGNTALHHISRQCLSTELDDRTRIKHTNYKTYQEYSKACLRLWRNYLSLGGSIDQTDAQGLPPLFYYLTANCERQHGNGETKSLTSGILHDTEFRDCMHYQHFYVFFAGVEWQPKHHTMLEEVLTCGGDDDPHCVGLLKHMERWLQE